MYVTEQGKLLRINTDLSLKAILTGIVLYYLSTITVDKTDKRILLPWTNVNTINEKFITHHVKFKMFKSKGHYYKIALK